MPYFRFDLQSVDILDFFVLINLKLFALTIRYDEHCKINTHPSLAKVPSFISVKERRTKDSRRRFENKTQREEQGTSNKININWLIKLKIDLFF